MISTKALDTLLATHQFSTQSAQASLGEPDIAVLSKLLNRIEALLQHPRETRETVLSAGSLRIDRLTRTVTRGDRTIRLLPREYLLLEYMMEHSGQLVTRAMLFTEVWATGSFRGRTWSTSTWDACAARSIRRMNCH